MASFETDGGAWQNDSAGGGDSRLPMGDVTADGATAPRRAGRMRETARKVTRFVTGGGPIRHGPSLSDNGDAVPRATDQRGLPRQAGPAGPVHQPAHSGESADIPEPSDERPANTINRAFVRLPSGNIVALSELINHNKEEGETSIHLGVFKPGDLVVFKDEAAEDDATGTVFEVTDTEWQNLSFHPSVQLTGVLHGLNLPEDVAGQEVTFIGSGWGGSLISPDIVTTDRHPYFMTPAGKEFYLPGTYAETFRETDTELKPLDPNQLDTQARTDGASHTERLNQTERVAALCGYTVMDSNPDTQTHRRDTIYQDERFQVEYSIGMGWVPSNQIVIFDQMSQMWMRVDYCNSRNEDLLEITVADFSEYDKEEIFQRGIGDPSFTSFDAAHTVFTSSNHFGLEAITYKPSVQEGRECLGVNVQPCIQIHPDGHIDITKDSSNSNYHVRLSENPDLADRVASAIASERTPDGEILIRLDNNRIPLPNPNHLLHELIAHMAGNPLH